jgi:hypothetical protein
MSFPTCDCRLCGFSPIYIMITRSVVTVKPRASFRFIHWSFLLLTSILVSLVQNLYTVFAHIVWRPLGRVHSQTKQLSGVATCGPQWFRVRPPAVFISLFLSWLKWEDNIKMDLKEINWPVYLSIYRPLLHLGRFFSFLILYTVGRTPWTGDQPVARLLPTHRTTHTINAHRHACLEWNSNPRSQRSNERRRFMP